MLYATHQRLMGGGKGFCFCKEHAVSLLFFRDVNVESAVMYEDVGINKHARTFGGLLFSGKSSRLRTQSGIDQRRGGKPRMAIGRRVSIQ